MKRILLSGLLAFAVVTLSLPAQNAEEARLIGVLQSASSPAEKEDACRRLKLIGTESCVPAVAKLLADEHLHQSACDVLETLPGKTAGEALHAALKTSAGKAKAGVVHALGEKRLRPASFDLAGLLKDPDRGLATAAARALGEIGGAEAVSLLRPVLDDPARHGAVADALLRCAVQLAAENDLAGARNIFTLLDEPNEKDHIRSAVFAGLIRASGEQALNLVVAAISGKDPARQNVALQLARDIQDPKTTSALTDLLPKATPAMQSALISLLQQRGDAAAAPAVLALARRADPYVRATAITALGSLGDATMVPYLAGAATSRDESEQKAARQALLALRRGPVGEAMVANLAVATPEAQAELARALAGRSEKSSVTSLLQLARSDSETTRKAAVRALGLLADGTHLAALVKLISEAKSDAAREDIRGVFESIVDRAEGRKPFEIAPLAGGLNSASTETRIALLQVSALFADELLRAAFRTALKDPDAQIRAAAARAMCVARDAGLLPDLLELARTSTELNLRGLALEGYVRLVREDASGFDAARRAELLKPAYQLAARPEEKRLVLSALTTAPHREALHLAERELADESVKAEAEIACAQIAKALLTSDPDLAETALQRLAAGGSATVRTNAQAILRQLNSGWLCAGPYRQAGKEAQALFDISFAPEQATSSPITWRRAPGSPDPSRAGEVVLDGIVGGDHCVVYLRTQVFVPAARPVNLEIGSDDGIKLWVNNELVHANNAVRGLTPGEDRAKATLRRGWNEFLAKITQHTVGCGMTLGIVTLDGKAVPGLRFDSQGASR